MALCKTKIIYISSKLYFQCTMDIIPLNLIKGIQLLLEQSLLFLPNLLCFKYNLLTIIIKYKKWFLCINKCFKVKIVRYNYKQFYITFKYLPTNFKWVLFEEDSFYLLLIYGICEWTLAKVKILKVF